MSSRERAASTGKVLHHMERDTPRDRGCTWSVLRNALFGSCGCTEDATDEELTNQQPSSSSGEWVTRRIASPTIKQELPATISSLTTSSNVEEDESGKCKSICMQLFKCCFPQSNRFSVDETMNSTNARHILINERQKTNYETNFTVTSKYTTCTFLPIFLFEQFRRYSNLFFLGMAILQQIPGISPTGRYITLFPLLFILTVSAIKEIAEDRKRHQTDKESNSRAVQRFTYREWTTVTWKDLHVGDIVKINDQEYFPADLMLLASSKPDGMCFVQTANLDGESNLKMRQSLPETMYLIGNTQLAEFKGFIECDPPNRRIYEFFGILHIPDGEPVVIGASQFLQRGAALSNTKWIYGIVIYTGHETKLMKSFSRSPLKSSSVERLLNKQFISLFGLFLLISFVSSGMNIFWVLQNTDRHTYLDLKTILDAKEIIFNLLTFMILYNNLIPISLQVTVEMVHYFQATFINSDLEMYHEETDTCAMARSSNLNEELGKVQYVLTDKTGTLTCNIMKFKKCSIAGILYEFSEDMENSELLKNIREGHTTSAIIEEFMLVITLCHSVVSEVKGDGTLIYHATNPDDQAIIEGAKRCGYEFINRGSDYIDIVRLGRPERYTLLQVIEFSSSRKRMSVIVRMPAGNIKLFCKGADTIILSRLSNDNEREYYNITREHLHILAKMGLRTLCCAVADITEEQFRAWIIPYQTSLRSFNNREEQLEVIANEIEKDLTLLGVTAIEDKLQDGVPETIDFILAAGIRIWMLTGDKQETAINIGYASGLLHHSMRLMTINEESMTNTFIALNSENISRDRLRNIALVIDGKTLEFALSKLLYEKFKSICLKCRVVICCRLSPVQKGKLTDLVNSTGTCTLAIGDGANDVAMIRKASVGVGISGLEGYQAASASDFSIAQFRFLKRLMFVHGTWNYHRITTLTLYSFYKNVILCIMLFWFCIYNGWSAQVLFDRWIIAGYNVFYTAWPALAIGIVDKVCCAKTLLKHPRIYSCAHNSKLFNVGIFWIWILNAILHSIIMFWVPIWLFATNAIVFPRGYALNLTDHGTMVYTAAVTVVCLKAGVTLHSWNYLAHISIWGSIGLWLFTIIIYSYFWPTLPMGPDFSYSHVRLFPNLMFWLFIIVLTVLTLLPDFFLKVFLNRYFLPLTEIALQEKN